MVVYFIKLGLGKRNGVEGKGCGVVSTLFASASLPILTLEMVVYLGKYFYFGQVFSGLVTQGKALEGLKIWKRIIVFLVT